MLSEHISATIEDFHTYPLGPPIECRTGYGLRFKITCICNGETMYRDSNVPFKELPENHSDEQIVEAAWAKIRPAIESWYDSVKTVLVGTRVSANVIDVAS